MKHIDDLRIANLMSWGWMDMTDAERMEKLKIMLEETDEDSRMLTDEQLTLLLEDAGGDLRRAAYQGALRKAHCTGISLPDGMTIESSREYWLTVARSYRGCATCYPERM